MALPSPDELDQRQGVGTNPVPASVPTPPTPVPLPAASLAPPARVLPSPQVLDSRPAPAPAAMTAMRGPTGALMNIDQARRRAALHAQAPYPETRLPVGVDPTAVAAQLPAMATGSFPAAVRAASEFTPQKLGADVRGFGAAGLHGLWNLARNLQPNPMARAEMAATTPGLEREYFGPSEEAAPLGAMAGGFAAQAPLFMAGGTLAEAAAPAVAARSMPLIMRLLGETPLAGQVAARGGEIGTQALADALAVQPTLPPETPLGERGRQTAMATAQGPATRAITGAIRGAGEAFGRGRGVPPPPPAQTPFRPYAMSAEELAARYPEHPPAPEPVRAVPSEADVFENLQKRRASDRLDQMAYLTPEERGDFGRRLRDERGITGKAAILEEALRINAAAGEMAKNRANFIAEYGTEEPGGIAKMAPPKPPEPAAPREPAPEAVAAGEKTLREAGFEPAPYEGGSIPSTAADLDRMMAEMRGETTPERYATPEELKATAGPPRSTEFLTMSPDELDAAHAAAKTREANVDIEVFGSKEKAALYDKLTRKRDSASNRMDDAAADVFQKQLDTMEEALSPKQRDRLFGIGETGPSADDLKDLRNAVGRVSGDTPDDLASSLKWAVTKVGHESDPAQMSHDEQIAFAQLHRGMQIAQEHGWDTTDLSQRIVKQAAGRFSDPADAAFMLRRWLGGKKIEAPTPKALPSGTVPTETVLRGAPEPSIYDTQPIPRPGERGSAPLGLAAPGAAAIEKAGQKISDISGARKIEGPTQRDMGVSKYVLSPTFNISRFGPKARVAIEDLRLTDERIHRVSQQKLHDWMEPLRGRRLKPHDYSAIADLIEGKTTTPATKEQAAVVGHLKPRFEAARQEYITYAKSRGFDIPADWGIKDYLPHYFPGEYRIFVKNAATGARDLVGSAYSKLDAMSEIRRIAAERNLKPDDFEVGHTKFVAPDVTRVSSPNKWRMVNEIADAAGIDKQDVADAMRGVIGTREGKSKWWANVQRRKGSAGYSKDIAEIVQRYVTSQTRHMELSKLNSRIQPALRDLRNSGLTNVADEIQSNLDMMWGVRSESAKALDATLSKTPGLNLIHRYGALERWTGRTRGGLARIMLMTPKFHLVMQPLQLAQTLYPVVGEMGMARAAKLYASAAGRAILDRHGVKYGVSRWTERPPISESLIAKVSNPQIRARLERMAEMGQSETRNQEFAFLALYDAGKRLGKSDTEAANYARLRGQMMTQFYPSVADMPKMMRGPVGKTVFQFRRFNIKNIELGMTLLREKNYPGAARWLGVNLLLGGLKTGLKIGAPLAGVAALGRLRQAPTYLSLKEYADIKKEHGETAADLVMYGLPGLMGIDLSNSVQMVDVPFGGSLPEMVGNTVLGPTGQLATAAISAGSASPGPEPSTAKRIGRQIAQRVPAVRMIDALRRAFTHDYDYTTPDGRLKFKADMGEVLKQMGGFRSTDRSDEELFLNAMTEVTASRSAAMNDAIAQAMSGDVAKGRATALHWNALWPEFPITNTDIKRRMASKQKMATVPLPQRMLQQAPKTIQRGMAPLQPETVQPPQR